MKIILKIRMLKTRVKLSFIFVMQIDWVLGEVKKAVKSAGIEEETIIMVSSDNGSFMYRLNPDRPDHTDDPTIQGYRAENHKANGNLRGTKGSPKN
ncbi:hypothetical protein ES708_17167 [subsurface metagenome]